MKNLEVLDESQLMCISGGKKKDWVKCYVGAIGSAVGGFAAGGPLGYWGGAAVGYATFCR